MAHDFKKFPELTNNQMIFYYFDSPHQQITENFEAEVVDVHDGDTIRVKTDFRDFAFPIRFLNIQAPELDESGGKESKKWLENLILGENIIVEIDNRNRVGKWGRLLGNIILEGININELSLLERQSKLFEEAKIGTKNTF